MPLGGGRAHSFNAHLHRRQKRASRDPETVQGKARSVCRGANYALFDALVSKFAALVGPRRGNPWCCISSIVGYATQQILQMIFAGRSRKRFGG